MINLVEHEVTHAYYFNRCYHINSTQTPLPSSSKFQKFARMFRGKPAAYEKYSLLVKNIILDSQSDYHYGFRDTHEKYGRTAELAAGIYASKLIKSMHEKGPDPREMPSILAGIDPEHVDVTLEIAAARQVQNVIGATLREIVLQPRFITTTDKNKKCNLIGVTNAFNALVAFRDLYKNR